MKQFTIAIVTTLLIIAAGCSHQSNAPVQSNPGQPVVSQSAQQELAAGLNATLPEAAPSAPGSDPLWPPNPNVDAYSVTVVWGTLPGVDPTSSPTDWSGTLSVIPAGEIKPASIISFEKGQDSVIATHNPLQAAWRSLTLADFDGLHFLVFIDRTSPLTVMPSLTFATGPVTFTRGLADVTKFDTIIYVDNYNAMAMIVRKLPKSSCPRGAIAGVWTRADIAGASGTFDGKWLGPNNTPIAKMTGKFWTDENGEKFFFGKYADSASTVLGYVRGKWWYDDPRMCVVCGSGHGFFAGHYTNADTVVIGDLAAEFGDLTAPSVDLGLQFRGVWKLNCDKADVTSLQQ